MAEMNQQFKQIIESINELGGRFDLLSKQINEYHCKPTNFEKAVNKKFNEYDALIIDKATNKLCTALQQCVNEVEEKLESLSILSKNDSLSKEAYSKRRNILVHSSEENKLSAWDKKRRHFENI